MNNVPFWHSLDYDNPFPEFHENPSVLQQGQWPHRLCLLHVSRTQGDFVCRPQADQDRYQEADQLAGEGFGGEYASR